MMKSGFEEFGVSNMAQRLYLEDIYHRSRKRDLHLDFVAGKMQLTEYFNKDQKLNSEHEQKCENIRNEYMRKLKHENNQM